VPRVVLKRPTVECSNWHCELTVPAEAALAHERRQKTQRRTSR
jgi:hypothetical protein